MAAATPLDGQKGLVIVVLEHRPKDSETSCYSVYWPIAAPPAQPIDPAKPFGDLAASADHDLDRDLQPVDTQALTNELHFGLFESQKGRGAQVAQDVGGLVKCPCVWRNPSHLKGWPYPK